LPSHCATKASIFNAHLTLADQTPRFNTWQNIFSQHLHLCQGHNLLLLKVWAAGQTFWRTEVIWSACHQKSI